MWLAVSCWAFNARYSAFFAATSICLVSSCFFNISNTCQNTQKKIPFLLEIQNCNLARTRKKKKNTPSWLVESYWSLAASLRLSRAVPDQTRLLSFSDCHSEALVLLSLLPMLVLVVVLVHEGSEKEVKKERRRAISRDHRHEHTDESWTFWQNP